MKKHWLTQGTILSCILLTAVGMTPAALAFCGFFVTKTPSDLSNSASRVIIARNGNRSVFTMANNFQGEVKDFVRIVPIPVIPKREQVRIGSNEIIDRLDAFTAPRLTEYQDYPCNSEYNLYPVVTIVLSIAALLGWVYRRNKRLAFTFLLLFIVGGIIYSISPSFMPQANKAKSLLPKNALNVKVAEQFTVGEYDVTILSATQSDGLIQWLTQNGYQVPDQAKSMLQDYIKNGMKFFVVKINLAAFQKAGYGFLRPIVIEYESPKFMLPIRLGTLNATTDQDLIIHILSPVQFAAVANYPTVLTPTDAKSQAHQVSGEEFPGFLENEFGDFYEKMFQRQYEQHGKNVAFLEYAGSTFRCDPCSAKPPTHQELKEAGAFWGDSYITRIHVRYTAEKFPEDLVFQEVSQEKLLEKVKAEGKFLPNKAGVIFQSRYVIRKLQGSTFCFSGFYYNMLKNQGGNHLSKLTGWSEQEIQEKMTNYEQATRFHQQGESWEKSQNYQAALDAYSQALQLAPKNPVYLFNKGRVLYELQRYSEALEVLEKVTALPNTTDQKYLESYKQDLRERLNP